MLPDKDQKAADCSIPLLSKELCQKFRNRLEKVKEEGKRVALVVHKLPPPDPDCVASVMALQSYCALLGIEADIFGFIGISHPQNKAMLNRLKVEMKDQKFWEKNQKNYGLVVFCDCDSNNAFLNAEPDVVIDHHAEHDAHDCGKCLIIRKKVGANSTIVYCLLKELGMSFTYPSKVATALVIGIDTDTKFLTKSNEVTDFDIQAHRELSFFMDYSLFAWVSFNYEIPKSFFKCLKDGLKNFDGIFNEYLALIGVGDISHNQIDFISMIADWVFRIPETRLVVVIGMIDGQFIKASVRSDLELIQIDDFCQEVFGGSTSMVGTRPGSGGATIQLSDSEKEEWKFATPEEREVLFRVKMKRYSKRINELISPSS